MSDSTSAPPPTSIESTTPPPDTPTTTEVPPTSSDPPTTEGPSSDTSQPVTDQPSQPPPTSESSSLPPSDTGGPPSDSGSAIPTSSDTITNIPSNSESSIPPSQTTITSTFVTTGADGATITTLIVSESTVPGSAPTGDSSGASSGTTSRTGAIAGGVVGGVVGLALLAVLTWFLLRRAKQRRIEKEFDGNFDPDRFARPSGSAPGGTLPNVGSTDDDDGMGGRLAASTVGGGVVSPYGLYQSTPSESPPRSPQPMSQFSHNDATTTSSGYAPYDPYSNPHSPSQMPVPMPVAGIYNQGPPSDTSSPSAYSRPSGVIPSAKEREAMSQQGRFNVINPDIQENYVAPSSSSVLVHQDGGRLDNQSPSSARDEIPPTYDSLQGGGGSSRPTEKH